MKKLLTILSITFFMSQISFAQSVEDQIKTLSKDKWQWMADRDVDKLGKLFDSQAMFVHRVVPGAKNVN